MDRHVRIGDGRLLEVVVDAAAAALVAGLQLDRHPRAVVDVDPLDAVFLDGLAARVVGRDLHAFAAAVEDFGPVPLGVDLDFVVMGRRRGCETFDMILTGLPVVSRPYMPGGADADALLPAAHPQAVELRAVEQLAEDQRDCAF